MNLQADPLTQGAVAAARAGNWQVVEVYTDKLHDAGRTDDAAALRAMREEYQALGDVARHLRFRRTVWALLERRNVLKGPNQMLPGREQILGQLAAYDCPVGVRVDRPYRCVLVVPTDGEDMRPVGEWLVEVLQVNFPSGYFSFVVENHAVTAEGRRGEAILREVEESE